MKHNGLFVLLLTLVITVGLVAGFTLRCVFEADRPASGTLKKAAPPTTVSKRIGFKSLDAAGEISAEMSQFKAGISGTYFEVLLTNITPDRVVDLEYIKVVFYDQAGTFLDYGEGRLGKTLKPGESSSSFLYMAKGGNPSFYNENARAAEFDRIGSSRPYKKDIQQL